MHSSQSVGLCQAVSDHTGREESPLTHSLSPILSPHTACWLAVSDSRVLVLHVAWLLGSDSRVDSKVLVWTRVWRPLSISVGAGREDSLPAVSGSSPSFSEVSHWRRWRTSTTSCLPAGTLY